MAKQTVFADNRDFVIRPLDASTWPGFVALVDRHNGIFGGCWCTWFHRHPDPPERKALGNREFK